MRSWRARCVVVEQPSREGPPGGLSPARSKRLGVECVCAIDSSDVTSRANVKTTLSMIARRWLLGPLIVGSSPSVDRVPRPIDQIGVHFAA